MAWVGLSDLLADDKNYYGLLNPDEIGKIRISIPVDSRKHLKTSFLKKFDNHWGNRGVYIKDLFNTQLNYPEWALRSDGFLYNFTRGLVKIEGEYKFLTLYEIDIRDYLRTLDIEQLEEIAERTFYKWERISVNPYKDRRVPDFEKIAKFFNSVNKKPEVGFFS